MANYAIVGENKKKWSLKSFSSTCSRVNERDDIGFFFFLSGTSHYLKWGRVRITWISREVEGRSVVTNRVLRRTIENWLPINCLLDKRASISQFLWNSYNLKLTKFWVSLPANHCRQWIVNGKFLWTYSWASSHVSWASSCAKYRSSSHSPRFWAWPRKSGARIIYGRPFKFRLTKDRKNLK